MGKKRDNTVFESAIVLSEKHGYNHITREQIAMHANCSEGKVSFRLGTMAQMRVKIVRYAIRTDNKRIIAQAIIAGDSHVRKLSEDEKRAALDSIL